jgi:hypothetical protein
MFPSIVVACSKQAVVEKMPAVFVGCNKRSALHRMKTHAAQCPLVIAPYGLCLNF